MRRTEYRCTEAGVVYGYVRVSTREQNKARQIDAMEAFGVNEVLIDKLSGKDFNRPRYQEPMRRISQGDVLVVKSIDRLGRNYEDILLPTGDGSAVSVPAVPWYAFYRLLYTANSLPTNPENPITSTAPHRC